eukprot:gene12836-15071_t
MNPYAIPESLIPQFREFAAQLPALDGDTPTFAPQAWFLGPKSENADLFNGLVASSFKAHIDTRKAFHKEDSPIFEEGFKKHPDYIAATKDMKEKADTLVNFLKHSLPYSSFRYIGHMTSDVTIGSVVGYLAAILYNANNVTVQASPVTTFIEMACGNDLCRMVGYPFPVTPKDGFTAKQKTTLVAPWAHITSGGTVANAEAFWSLYWTKFIPSALQQALLHEETLVKAANVTVTLANGKTKPLSLCTAWECCNLSVDECVNLPYVIGELCAIDPSQVTFLLKTYHISTIGSVEFFEQTGIRSPNFMAPASGHYSIPKAAALLGLGSSCVKILPVDKHARMELISLRAELNACLNNKIPVVAVVNVLGTTEETAVDNIHELLNMRDEFRTKGLNFAVHVDAAWGGYFLSCIRKDYKLEDPIQDSFQASQTCEMPSTLNNLDGSDPEIYCSTYFVRQLQACARSDSITIDPHKAGYIPYPAGSICYRNQRCRDILVYTASYIGGSNIPSVGIYGIEGSKPGAAACAVYLSHAILRTSKSGYGKILKRCLLNTKLFYLRLLWLCSQNDNFIVHGTPVPPTPTALAYLHGKLIHNGVWLTSEQIAKDTQLVKQLAEIGPDQNIVCYSFNFREKDGKANTDYTKYCEFNDKIYKRFDYIPEEGMKEYDVIISNTEFGPSYGTTFLNALNKRIGITNAPVDSHIPVLRSTIMDPFANETTTGSSYDGIFKILKTQITAIAKTMQGTLPA